MTQIVDHTEEFYQPPEWILDPPKDISFSWQDYDKETLIEICSDLSAEVFILKQKLAQLEHSIIRTDNNTCRVLLQE